MPRGNGMLQYLAFVYAFIGVVLCAAALAFGRNLNYSLWPPTLPVNVLALLGGSRYRVTIGCVLAFVLGPIMRHLAVPAAAGLSCFFMARSLGIRSRDRADKES